MKQDPEGGTREIGHWSAQRAGARAPLLISSVSLCHHALIKGARMVHRLNEKSDFIASCKNRLIGEKFAFGLGLLETARAARAPIRMRDATEGH